MRYLIIGNGASGITAAETIRRLDEKGEITIVSDERVPFYSRCLTPELVSGEMSEEELLLRPEDFYEARSIEALLGKRAVKIKPEEKSVELDDGSIIAYDKLLLATGCSPLFPEIEGIDKEGVLGLRTIEDAKRIIAYTQGAKEAVVIGGGLVGLRAAFALKKRGLSVKVIEMLPRVLPEQLDEVASEILSRAIEKEGINLVLKGEVEEILGEKRVEGVALADGRRFDCDLVIVAVGVRPNVELAKGAGIEVDKGIIVDPYMRTSIPEIYAAGDVAETLDPVTGERTLSALWPSAVEQGRLAGLNMAGIKREYQGALSILNSIELAGVPIISIGIVRQEEGYEVLATRRGDVYRKLLIRENRLVGAIFVNEIERAGLYTALIRQGFDISELKEGLRTKWFNYGYLLRKEPIATEAYAL
jgi:NAD(P)H-nitrite reductase large subunit